MSLFGKAPSPDDERYPKWMAQLQPAVARWGRMDAFLARGVWMYSTLLRRRARRHAPPGTEPLPPSWTMEERSPGLSGWCGARLSWRRLVASSNPRKQRNRPYWDAEPEQN